MEAELTISEYWYGRGFTRGALTVVVLMLFALYFYVRLYEYYAFPRTETVRPKAAETSTSSKAGNE